MTGGREDLGTRLIKVCYGTHKEMASGFLLFSKWRFISCREGKPKKFVIHVFNLNLSWSCDFYFVNRVKKMRPETIFSLFLAFFYLLWSSKIHPLPTKTKKEKKRKKEGEEEKWGRDAPNHRSCDLHRPLNTQKADCTTAAHDTN